MDEWLSEPQCPIYKGKTRPNKHDYKLLQELTLRRDGHSESKQLLNFGHGVFPQKPIC
jgi:hypothetical protein